MLLCVVRIFMKQTLDIRCPNDLYYPVSHKVLKVICIRNSFIGVTLKPIPGSSGLCRQLHIEKDMLVSRDNTYFLHPSQNLITLVSSAKDDAIP